MVNPWPVPRFHFQVTWGWGKMICKEVCGLDIDASMAESLRDLVPDAPVEMPGMKRGGNVLLKTVTVKSDRAFRDWLAQAAANAVRPGSVTVSLIFEDNAPSMVWVLANAWPLRIEGVNVPADAPLATIASLTLVHDGMTTLKC